jgi:hypothetical protein
VKARSGAFDGRPVLQARGLGSFVRLYGIWVLIVVSFVVVGCLLAVNHSYVYRWHTYQRYADAVEIRPFFDKECPVSDFYARIGIQITNLSSKTLEGISFALEAREVGHSTVVSKCKVYEYDRILQPNQKFSGCASFPV